MGFIDEAISYGYQAKDILDMLGQTSPEFKGKIQEALKYGYTPAVILRDIATMFQNPKGEKTAKALGINPKYTRNLAFSEDLDPAYTIQEQMKGDAGTGFQDTIGQMAGAGIGAGIGLAMGGPAGAIGGAAAGSDMYQQLVDRYRKSKEEGKALSFADFVKSLAIASSKGTAVGFSTKFLMDVLNKLSKGESPEEQGAPQEGQGKPSDVKEGFGVPTPEDEKPFSAYDYFKGKGVDNIISQFAGKMSPQEGRKAFRKLFGNTYVKDVERELKMPFEKAIGMAFDEVSGSMQKPEPHGIFAKYQGLTEPQMNRIRTIEKQIDTLRQKGVKEDSQRIRKLKERRDQIAQGKGMSMLDEERMRFEKGYGPMETTKASKMKEIFQGNIPKGEEIGEIQKSIKPLENSLKSSNVLGAFFNKDTGKLRTVFGNGEIYEYDNISFDELNKVTGGNVRPVTEGENEFGIWFQDKKKSVGAAFNQYIKKKAEEFPYRKLEKSEYRPKEEQLRTANRTFLASGIFEPFKTQRKKGRQMEKGKILRDIEPSLKNMDDEFLQDVVAYLEDKLSTKLKHPPKVSRLQKEFRKEFL